MNLSLTTGVPIQLLIAEIRAVSWHVGSETAFNPAASVNKLIHWIMLLWISDMQDTFLWYLLLNIDIVQLVVFGCLKNISNWEDNHGDQ